MGGPAAVQAFVLEFQEDCRARIARLNYAIPALDRIEIERQAHDLKSNAANLGLLVLTQAAAVMEAEALESEPGRLVRLHRELTEALEAAMKDLAAYFRPSTSA